MARILVADDDSNLRAVLRLTLEHAGHHVVEAADGREAMARVRESEIDLVVTDMLMPEMDGLEAIQKLRALRPGIRIIGISGGGRIDAKNYLTLAAKLGAARVLTKPFPMQDLVAAVAETLAAP